MKPGDALAPFRIAAVSPDGMKAWAKFVETASGRQHHTHFATLDEYIPYRVIDVGQM